MELLLPESLVQPWFTILTFYTVPRLLILRLILYILFITNFVYFIHPYMDIHFFYPYMNPLLYQVFQPLPFDIFLNWCQNFETFLTRKFERNTIFFINDIIVQKKNDKKLYNCKKFEIEG